jgi:large subunit ribosomal protein L21
MAYAVIKTGGKQYRVAAGDVLEIDRLTTEAGKDATFSEVLLASDGKTLKAGTELKGAKVVAEVLAHTKGAKVVAFKYKRRKGYHRTVGHRAQLTKVKIKSIA